MLRPLLLAVGLLGVVDALATPVEMPVSPPSLWLRDDSPRYARDDSHFFYSLGLPLGPATSSYDANTDVLSGFVSGAFGPVDDFMGRFQSTLTLVAFVDEDGLSHGGSLNWFSGDNPDIGLSAGTLLLSADVLESAFSFDLGTPRFEVVADVTYRYDLLDIGDLVGLVLYHSPFQSASSPESAFWRDPWSVSVAAQQHYLTDGLATIRAVPEPATPSLVLLGAILLVVKYRGLRCTASKGARAVPH